MDEFNSKTEAHAPMRGARVLIVTTIPLTLTSFLTPWARHLARCGAHVDAASGPATPSERGALDVFERFIELPFSRSLRTFANYHACKKALFEALDEGDYDIVHVHTPIAAFMTRALVAAWKRARSQTAPTVVYTAHGFHFFHGQKNWAQGRLFRALEKRALRWTDALIVMNDEDERAAQTLLSKAAGVSCELSRIDGVGLDFSRYEAARVARAQRGPAPVVTIGVIAEHNANKDLGLLLDALAYIDHDATPFRCVFVGDGPLTDALVARAKALHIDDRVVFTGRLHRKELDTLIATCDIGMLTSQREGLPRSLMEFCASGALIAGTATRGIIDEVRDERALAQRDPRAIAAMLTQLLGDAALRDEIAHKQYAYARAHFDNEVVFGASLALYERYLSLRG